MNERSIFLEALQRDDLTQRAEYLDTACAGDATLRMRVEALLESHQKAGAFLDKLAPQRLAEELADQQDAAATHAESQDAERSSVDLSFLAAADKPGSLGRLGHYDIQAVVGCGGMGIVVRAFDEKLHRVVAIKVMAAQLATNATARKRFTREAQAAAAVCHDHVVTIHAVEEANGLPYLVMQYVEGISLAERLTRDGPLDLHEILRIAMQTASGLAAAHAQGLIHRDIKPANILLENGVERVKITDFGLARAATDASLTHAGEVAGTPQYMAPEQARGEAVDHRADLFSLGSVLYAMCTGLPPFRASGSMAVLKRLCEETPRPIRELNPAIPDWLVAIIETLHAKEPAARYQSAAEVADLLNRHLADVQHPALAPPPRAPQSGRAGTGTVRASDPGVRRRWALAAALVFVVLGSLSLTEATGVTSIRATAIRIFTPEGTLVVETDDPGVKVTIEGDGGLVITGAGPQEVRLKPGSYRLQAAKDGRPVRLDQELVTIARGDKQVVRVSLESPGQSAALPKFEFRPPPPGPLDALDPARIPPEERFSWQPPELVAVLGEHRGRVWSEITCVAFSPDGKLAASCGYEKNVYIWDADTLRLRTVLMGHTAALWSVAFSPDSQRLLSSGADATIRVWDLQQGKEIRRLEGHRGEVTCVAVSPDGRTAVSAGADHSVRLWDVETGQQLRQFEGHTNLVRSVSFVRDGSQVLSGSNDQTMRLWAVDSGREVRRFNYDSTGVWLKIAPGGRRAMSSSQDDTVRLWDLETGAELRRFEGHTDDLHWVDISPDGRRALSTGKDASIRLWDVETGKPLRTMTVRHAGNLTSLGSAVFSPDGRRVLSGDDSGALILWNLEDGRQLVSPTAGERRVQIFRLDFAPDGHRALTCMGEDVARLWDVATGRQLYSLRMSGHVACCAFSSDGQQALTGGGAGLTAWSVASGRELRRFAGVVNVYDVAVSHDGRSVLTGDHPVGADGTVRLWQLADGHELLRLRGHGGAVFSVAISPDGRFALSGGWDNTVRLWDLKTGQQARAAHGHSNHIWSLAYSADGRFAASSDDDGFVRLWELNDAGLEPRALPKSHDEAVRSITFSPDARMLASGGFDGRVILWDIASGVKVREWKLPGRVRDIAWTPDGRHLGIVNGNGTVYILRLAKPQSNTREDQAVGFMDRGDGQHNARD